jgi:hypothetical protein
MRHALPLLLLVLAVPAYAADSPTQVHLTDSNKAVQQKCKEDMDVFIDGNHATVKIIGTCRFVRVTGNDNTVAIDGSETIQVVGNNNAVAYKSSSNVTNNGNGNTVKQSK